MLDIVWLFEFLAVKYMVADQNCLNMIKCIKGLVLPAIDDFT